jgi:hypothetical protein
MLRGGNMERKLLTISIVLCLLLGSCTNTNNIAISKGNVDVSKNNLKESQELKLPEGFTTDKIKSALLEYINYRLWLYPIKIMDSCSDKDFDEYVGKSIEVELRMYNTNSEKAVYAYTNVGKWLAIFRSKDGFVYCDGQVGEGEYGWPSNTDDYTVIEKYNVTIPPAHKPDYGTSKRKAKMIAALESSIKAACQDFYRGADKFYEEWADVEVYIVDFYEYEGGTHAWICSQGGAIIDFPVIFEELNDEFKVQTLKGFTLNSKNEFNQFGRFQYDRDISDSVKHFRYKQK